MKSCHNKMATVIIDTNLVSERDTETVIEHCRYDGVCFKNATSKCPYLHTKEKCRRPTDEDVLDVLEREKVEVKLTKKQKLAKNLRRLNMIFGYEDQCNYEFA